MKVHEAIPELPKNILLVMKASGILSNTSASGENTCWEATWLQVNKIAPSVQLEVFPDNEGKTVVEREQNMSDSPAQEDQIVVQ